MIQIFVEMCRNKLFLSGLFLRLLMVFLVIAATQEQWFVPFVNGVVNNLSLDPWSNHVIRGGSPLSFPYGPVMLLAFLPLAILFNFFDLFLSFPYLPFFAHGLTLLFFDFLCFCGLIKILPTYKERLILWYWLSPIVLYATYWHGQNDIIPVSLLVLALLFIKKRQPVLSGGILSCALAAKLSMSLAVPFFLIYIIRGKRNRHLVKPFVLTVVAGFFFGHIVWMLSPGFILMVMQSPEIAKIYNVAIPIGEGTKLYVLPVVVALSIYGAWRIERISFELLVAMLGISFLSILILTPASGGWFTWVLPFLVAFQAREGKKDPPFVLVFSLIYVLTYILFASGSRIWLFGINLQQPILNSFEFHHLHSLLLTGLSALALLVAIRMYIYGIRKNEFFRLSRAPVVVGISGDSGAGKDTLARAISSLFGEDAVTNISGDDYHKWDRKAPMWKALTHLDPRANNLGGFLSDLSALIVGKPVLSRHYNHETGLFSKAVAVDRNPVIVASGLHVLYLSQIRSVLDVAIFLDMDPDLRNFLKIKRDVTERGKKLIDVEESIKKRIPDSEKYIVPQKNHADLVFSVLPSVCGNFERSVSEERFRLRVKMASTPHYEELIRKLIGICGLHVDLTLEDGKIEIMIDGEVTSEDLEVAASDITIGIEEILAITPKWYGGVLGIMQLITISQIKESLMGRLGYVN